MESKTFILNNQCLDLVKIIEESIDILKLKADEKGINLFIKDKKRFPRLIYSDGGRVQQILVNLISNAIKYTIHGYVRISGKIDADANYLWVIVQDTGVGIS